MVNSIPYDPSLALGNIVVQEKLDVLKEIGKKQAPIEAAEDKLNSAIELRRSLDMTMQELANMRIDTSKVASKLADVNKNITDAASELAEVRIENGQAIIEEKAKLDNISENIESPIDYNRTMIKKMPLSADSLNLDAQYFSFEENKQNSKSTISSIKAFVQASTSVLGTRKSSQATFNAERQVSSQVENHDIAGTLVITATCTHKDAVLLAPFILDVDKAIRVWNAEAKKHFPNKLIKMDSPSAVADIAREEGTKEEETLNIISGATYGSSFVGMVHILRSKKTQSFQAMQKSAFSVQAQIKKNMWFANKTGGFGLSGNFARDLKSLMSSEEVSSHVSLDTIGVIPSITANNIETVVKQFGDFSPDAMTSKLAVLANNGTDSDTNMQANIDAARSGSQMMALQAGATESVMSSVVEADRQSNKVLDVNSLMTAFENYIEKIGEGSVGVPINYYIKPITRAQLAQMWVSKYYPGEFLAISGDDSKASGKIGRAHV